jgi:hypothetical protein
VKCAALQFTPSFRDHASVLSVDVLSIDVLSVDVLSIDVLSIDAAPC